MADDIYKYDMKIEALHRTIAASTLDEECRKMLIDFDRSLLLTEGLSKPRRLKLVFTIFLVFRTYLRKGIREVTKEDIKDWISAMESRNVSTWTIAGYKIALKKFFRWLEYGDNVTRVSDTPELVGWFRIHVKKKNQPHVKASDILTEDEIHRLIAAAEKPRDRAFISMLYELGARISEIGNLKIGDISRDEHSYIIDLSGKTGHRTPRIIMSDPFLTEWIDHHPLNKDPTAPLWVIRRDGVFAKMLYGGLRELVQRLRRRAGITKRIYPHLFRHSRVTHLLMKRYLNEAQAKVYFGWAPDSKMLSEYSHLVSRDVNDVILQIHGITPEDKKEAPKVKECPRCRKINAADARYCIY
ncbi:MAG: tyrosine-type recombinase/integrase, partial [Bacteroidota bacterium]